MSRIFAASVYLETEPNEIAAPDGPGWYVDIRMFNGRTEIAPKVKIDQGLAKLLATAFEKAIAKGKPNYHPDFERDDISITEAVSNATEAGKQEVKNQLIEAQALVQKIADLQRTYGELGGTEEV